MASRLFELLLKNRKGCWGNLSAVIQQHSTR